MSEPGDSQQKKKNENPPKSEFCHPSRPKSENKRKQEKKQVPKPCKIIFKILYMKVKVILIMVGALGKIPKELVKKLEDLKIRRQMETIQSKAFLKSVRIERRALGTWGYFLSLIFQGITTC